MTIIEKNERLLHCTETAFAELNRLKDSGTRVDLKTFLKTKQTIKEINRKEPVSIAFIKRTICEYFFRRTDVQEVMKEMKIDLNVESLQDFMFKNIRKRPLPEMRFTFWYYVRQKFGTSLKSLGTMSGVRDHSSVIHGLQSYQDWIDTEKEMKEQHEVYCQLFEL